MRGYLYILSNNAMPNLFKIGFTTRTITERIRELSSTGVPGAFEVEFFAEVDDAYTLEKTVHNKLSRQRYDNEFFRCELRTAVRVAKESIMENGYDILSHGGKGSSAFLTETELLEIQRAAQEQKLKQAAALIERQRIGNCSRPDVCR
jgi:T5orf172 domain